MVLFHPICTYYPVVNALQILSIHIIKLMQNLNKYPDRISCNEDLIRLDSKPDAISMLDNSGLSLLKRWFQSAQHPQCVAYLLCYYLKCVAYMKNVYNYYKPKLFLLFLYLYVIVNQRRCSPQWWRLEIKFYLGLKYVKLFRSRSSDLYNFVRKKIIKFTY